MKDEPWKQIRVFAIGRGQDISAWQTDPRPVLMMRHRVGLAMVPPEGLDGFLSPDEFDRSNVQFIHGAKGSGKTSLLLAKRALLDEVVAKRRVLCVPSGFPYVFSPFMDPTATIRFETWDSLAFSSAETWKFAWLVLLGAFILNALEKDQERQRPEGSRERLLDDDLIRSLTQNRTPGAQLEEERWVDYFKNLIENTPKSPRETFQRLYTIHIYPKLKNSVGSWSSPILVFVDGIDETFVGPGGSPLMKLAKSGQVRPLDASEKPLAEIEGVDPNEKARNIWVTAQTSLLSVSTELLIATEGKVKLVGSMRSEAYSVASRGGSQAGGQLANIVREIKYSRHQLEAIFRANIRLALGEPVDKPLQRDDEIQVYFGTTQISNPQSSIQENIFDYLCRHTFEEPRDLMVIGNALHDMTGGRHDSHRLHAKVSDITQQILHDYLRFIDEDWDDQFEKAVFEQINKNVLSFDDAKAIAQHVKAEAKTGEDHPLCLLHKCGLVGAVSPSLEQVFQRVAQVEDIERSHLPKSAAYLIHPVLDSAITKARRAANKDEYLVVQGLAVGNGLRWIPGACRKRVNLLLNRTQVHLEIDGTKLSTSESGRKSYLFHTITDIPTAIFVACIFEMANMASNEPLIENVMLTIRGWAEKNLIRPYTRREGRNKLTVDYIHESLTLHRTPTQFETINDRLKEHNFTNIAIVRNIRNGWMSVRGIEWDEIELAGDLL